MLLSRIYDEKHSLLIIQYGGVLQGAEGVRSVVEYIHNHKVLPAHIICDFRKVTSADLVDSDGALLAYMFRSLPFPAEQVRTIRVVLLVPSDPKHPLFERSPSLPILNRYLAQWTVLTSHNDPERDWLEALSSLDLPSTIAQPD